MRSENVVLAAILLATPVLAGCLERAPPQPADEPAPTPPPSPPAQEAPPRPIGKPPEGFAECVELEVRAQPPIVHPGQAANVTATLRNLCDHEIQIQGTESCTRQGVEAWIEWNGTRYFLQQSGAAVVSQNCLFHMPRAVAVAAGAEHVVSWAWNGTLYRSNATGGEGEWLALPPGEHPLVARIVLPSGLPEARDQIHVARPTTPS